MLQSHVPMNAALMRLPRGPERFGTRLGIANSWNQAFGEAGEKVVELFLPGLFFFLPLSKIK